MVGWLAVTAIGVAWSAPSEVIDEVVAVVGDRVITSADVAIERELAARDPSPVPPLQAARSDPLQALVDRAVIRELAGDIGIYQPSAAAVRARAAALTISWVDPAPYARFLLVHGLTDESLSGRLRSQMIVERYVLRNLSPGADADPAVFAERYERWIAARRAEATIRMVGAP